MDNNNYIQTETGLVFKMLDDHFLKMSPWEDGEDRRVHEEDLGSYHLITYKNACMIVNTQFDTKVECWNHKGKDYLANSIGTNKNVVEHSYFLSTLPSHKVFLKNSSTMLANMSNGSVTVSNEDGSIEMKLIKHKGKMYYILIINEYLPRVQAYNMLGEFCQWIGIDHCKPIFNITDNKYI